MRDWGFVDTDKKVILVKRGLRRESQWITLLHEILHVIFEDTKLDKDLPRIKKDEPIINRIDKALHKVLSDNNIIR